jgi:hypothetical protein
MIDAAGITRVPLPPRSPNLHAYAERWVRSVKEAVLPRLILCGERALQHALTEYVMHFHQERPHQGRGHVERMSASSAVDVPAEQARVITAYPPDPEAWEVDQKTRRRP